MLCLHDELLVHAPTDRIDEAVAMVETTEQEPAHYVVTTPDVRFVAAVSVVDRCSEAK